LSRLGRNPLKQKKRSNVGLIIGDQALDQTSVPQGNPFPSYHTNGLLNRLREMEIRVDLRDVLKKLKSPF